VIPLKDENPTRRFAVVTLVLVLVCAGVYFGVQPDINSPESNEFSFEYAAIPCELTTNEPLSPEEVIAAFERGDTTACNTQPESPPVFPDKNVWLAAVVSMFLHGSFMHLAGNMLFLWIFGNNIEDRLGRVPYLAFYLVGGAIATATHVLVQPSSTVPVVGASGAIAAVMGAYLAWYPNHRIHTLFFFFFIFFRDISAKWLLGIWFVTQFFDAFNPNSGVAWGAHVGGFVFGVVGGLLLRPFALGRQRVQPSWD
jgi:membrane associated rhomboid family serine protease